MKTDLRMIVDGFIIEHDLFLNMARVTLEDNKEFLFNFEAIPKDKGALFAYRLANGKDGELFVGDDEKEFLSENGGCIELGAVLGSILLASMVESA